MTSSDQSRRVFGRSSHFVNGKKHVISLFSKSPNCGVILTVTNHLGSQRWSWRYFPFCLRTRYQFKDGAFFLYFPSKTYWKIPIHVGNPIINLPFGGGLYPIFVVILGMAYGYQLPVLGYVSTLPGPSSRICAGGSESIVGVLWCLVFFGRLAGVASAGLKIGYPPVVNHG